MVLTASVDIKRIREKLKIKKEKRFSSTILLDNQNASKKIKGDNNRTHKDFFIKTWTMTY